MIIHVTKENFKETLENNKKVLVDFWAPWCGPCRMLGQVLEEVSSKNPEIVIAKINCDEETVLSQMFEVSSIPYLLLFEDSKLVKKTLGYKEYQEILDFYG